MDGKIFFLVLVTILLQSVHLICAQTNFENGTDNSTAPTTNSTEATSSSVTSTTTPLVTSITIHVTSTPNTTNTTSLQSTATAPTVTSQPTTVPPTTRDTNATTMEYSTGTGHSNGTTSSPCIKHSSFDGASFVGGIVLGLGVCGIAWFAYRCYVSKHRANAPYQQF